MTEWAYRHDPVHWVSALQNFEVRKTSDDGSYVPVSGDGGILADAVNATTFDEWKNAMYGNAVKWEIPDA